MVETFGRFTVLGELGAGGMGRVYRAHDPTLRREVAIKVLRDDLGDAKGDLLAEARAASALNHPNICTIYDVGDAEGSAFIAMELVEGRPLNELIVGSGLPVDSALRIARQAAGALAAAHERGIVHGDLKGHNVLITPAGDVKLLDFGLARSPDPASLETVTRPATGAGPDAAIAGTLPFMAPETLRGAALTPAADVWAFGVLLHEMLTGSRPFGGASSFDVASAILHLPPPPLPDSVPDGLATVVARCLDKTPARRYATARELLAALEPIAPGPSRSGGRPAKPARRWTLPFAALALLVAIAAVVAVWRWPRGVPADSVSPVSSLIVLPFDDLSGGDAYFADGMTEALITTLSRIPTLTVISRTSAVRYKSLRKSTREIADELGVGAIVDGTVLRSDGQVRISVRLVDARTDRIVWGDDYTRDLKDVLTLQGDVARAIAARIQASFAPADEARLVHPPAIDPLAHEEYLKGRFQWNRRTSAALTQAIAHFRRALQIQPDYAPAYAGLAQSYVLLPAFPMAAMSPGEAFPLAIETGARAVKIDDGLAEAHAALAYARLHLFDVAGAEEGFRRALAINPGDATTHFWYAVAIAAAGRVDEAIVRARRGMAVDPVSPIVISGVSWMHHLARQFDKEIDVAREALALDPNFMMARYRLGIGYLHQDRFELAVEELEQARKLSANSLDLLAAVGYAHGRAGHRAEARRIVRELQDAAASKRRYVSPFGLALVHLGLDDRETALTWLNRAVDERAWGIVLLGVEPALDPLRSDSRFAALVARVAR